MLTRLLIWSSGTPCSGEHSRGAGVGLAAGGSRVAVGVEVATGKKVAVGGRMGVVLRSALRSALRVAVGGRVVFPAMEQPPNRQAMSREKIWRGGMLA